MKIKLTLVLTAVLLEFGFARASDLRIANLGDFELESGEVIRGLSIGYRTMGTLNPKKTNAVLFPTWFTGTTADLVPLVGPGLLVDSTENFVILVDALDDGVSSSPSNSTLQPRMKFPQFTIADMVRSQHRLLTEVLGIDHLKAVLGISMGGMQTFQWMVSFPDFMDKAVPIQGSPKLSSYDVFLWTAEIRAIQADPAWKGGDYESPPLEGLKTVAAIHSLALTTPAHVDTSAGRDILEEVLRAAELATIQGFDANNRIRQAQAMISLDISRHFGGSIEEAAKAVKAEVLVVVGSQDHMVVPRPALDFARLMFAAVLDLPSYCGHLALHCQKDEAFPVITRFLEQ